MLAAAARDLRLLQEERRGVDAGLAAQVDAFCARLDACAAAEEAFTLELDDPAGNSALEWFGDWEGGGAGGASSDPALKRRFYERTRQQNVDIGCMSEETMAEEEAQDARARTLTVVGAGAPKLGCSIVRSEGTDVMAALGRYSAPEEVMVFPGGCPDCAAVANTRMFATNIPYFRQVVVMCTSCDACGYRNSELRSGGEIPPMGRTTTLRVTGPRDLGRDVIKSETSDLCIPEIDLELGRGTLGGRVTTVEGLLTEVRDALQRTRFTTLGDSAVARERGQWEDFYARLEGCIQGETPFTLVLRDPLAGCFISASTDEWADDKQLAVEDFLRDWEEDEEFGLHECVAARRAFSCALHSRHPPCAAWMCGSATRRAMRSRRRSRSPLTPPLPHSLGHQPSRVA